MDISDLAGRLSSGRLFHAYIVTGADAPAREQAAALIARAAVCSEDKNVPCGICRDCVKARKGVHPDIETVRREEKVVNYPVEVMRSLRTRAAVVPNEAKRGVHVVVDADYMSPQAQNAMLKVLEEPPSHAVFVLLADNPQRLLETVRSRCETVYLTPEDAELDAGVTETAEKILEAYLKKDALGLVRAVQPMDKLSKAELFDLMTALRRMARDRAAELGGERLEKLLDCVEKGDKMVFANLKGSVVSGHLVAELCEY